MDLKNYQSLQEAYLDVYQELDEELTGGYDVYMGEEKRRPPISKMDDKIKQLNKKLKSSKVGSPEAKRTLERLGNITGTRDTLALKMEQVDAYDLILFHLLDEGYAETPEAAEVMMVNMSEEWRESIMEGKKPLPVSKMAKQARKKAFELGAEINSPTDEYGDPLPHYTPTEQGNKLSRQVRRMSKVGGSKVKSHIKKGYEMGSYYDPQEAKSKYYWLQRLNFKSPTSF